jgi:hypothetical protein
VAVAGEMPPSRDGPFTETKEFIAGFTVPTQDHRPASALKSLRGRVALTGTPR